MIAGCLAVFFVVSFGFMASQHLEEAVEIWDDGGSGDFRVWYRTAQIIGSPERSEIYARHEDGESITTGFFNPPSMAFLLWPLTQFDYRDGRTLFLVLSLAATVGLLVACWRLGLRGVPFLLAILALASFWPLYVSLEYSHPTPLYALLIAVALLEVEAKATGSAGGFVGLIALKPSLFAGPFGYLLWKRQWNALFTAIAVAAFLFLAPFLLLGWHAFGDFREMSSALTADSFRFLSNERVSIGAWGVLNWNGYVASLTLAAPPLVLIILLDAVTIALTLRVWAKGTLREGWLAGTAMMVLVLPHLLVYDWLILFVPAMAVFAERRTPLLLALLVFVHFGVNISAHALPFMTRGFGGDEIFAIRDYGGYWAVPALFLLLVYLAFRNEIDARLYRAGFISEAQPADLTPVEAS